MNYMMPAGRPPQTDAMRRLAESLKQTNAAIKDAVDAGVTVELVRASRCHDGRGHWGDQMMPDIRKD